MAAEKSVTPDAISFLIANPSPTSDSDLPDLVVQVVDLKRITDKKYACKVNDGKMKMKAVLSTAFVSQVPPGDIQDYCLIRILDYTVSEITSGKCVVVVKGEAICSDLEAEIKDEVKNIDAGIVLKPKQDFQSKPMGAESIAKSANQIMLQQNMAPSARLAMTRRVNPLVSLNPYQGNWTIKVRVTEKGNLRSYKNAKGDGFVFNVELTDEDGTQIQATMFNDAARKFYEKFQKGKVYYISKGTLRVANKLYRTLLNDYEMTLNANSEVEEVVEEAAFIPETVFNFVPIDQLGLYVNGRVLVDVIGVVKNVADTMTVRRKISNEMVQRREITIADESKKTVIVTLWNDLAANLGQELLHIVAESPIVAIKSLKVGDFNGLSLTTVGKSTVLINPDLPESKRLKSWYTSEGKDAEMKSVGADMPSAGKSVRFSRATFGYIKSNPSLGQDKSVGFIVKGCITHIRQDKPMSYRACKQCNKKVTEPSGAGYWCEHCQKATNDCNLRYLVSMKAIDSSGEAWFVAFNDAAENIIGCTAEDLEMLKNDLDQKTFNGKMNQAVWVPHLLRISVEQDEYMGEKKQKIVLRSVLPIDYALESKIMLDEMAKLQTS